MKTLGITWAGTFSKPIWKSETVIVTALFIREDDETKEAQITVSGHGDSVMALSTYIEENLSPQVTDDTPKQIIEELKWFDVMHKPNLAYLKVSGAPETYVNFLFKEYEEKRKKKTEELNRKYRR